MEDKRKNLIAVIILVAVVLVVCIILYFINRQQKPSGINSADDIPTTPKKYGVNEYSSLLITDNQLCTIYFNDYLSLITTDINAAYNALDVNYRNTKFPTIDSFRTYINSIYPTISSIDKYYVSGEEYYIIDKNGNEFVFVTNGIMNYKVYLDVDTVEITAKK